MSTYESLLSEAIRLPANERRQLIDALWVTLDTHEASPLSEEWMAEIERRSADYDAGLVKTIPWETVRRDLWKKIGLPDDS